MSAINLNLWGHFVDIINKNSLKFCLWFWIYFFGCNTKGTVLPLSRKLNCCYVSESKIEWVFFNFQNRAKIRARWALNFRSLSVVVLMLTASIVWSICESLHSLTIYVVLLFFRSLSLSLSLTSDCCSAPTHITYIHERPDRCKAFTLERVNFLWKRVRVHKRERKCFSCGWLCWGEF